MLIKNNNLWAFFLIVLILGSCSTKKDVVYFNDVNTKDQDKVFFSANKIQINDILNITISSSSPELSVMYNLNQNPTTTTSTTGYLVFLPSGTAFPFDLTICKSRSSTQILPRNSNSLVFFGSGKTFGATSKTYKSSSSMRAL